MAKTIGELDIGRNNNFNLMRLTAAAMVVLSHSFWLTGHENIEPLMKLCGRLTLGSLGVKIFFAVSGYLITKSLFKQATLGGFIKARVLRIFPALFVASVFCAFVIGPVYTTLPLSAYLSHPAVYNFTWRLATLHNFANGLPGVFLSNPVPGNIDSPVWTLPGELLMYSCTFFAGVVMIVFKDRAQLPKAIPLLIAVVLFMWGVVPHEAGYLYNLWDWGLLFLLGGLSYIFRKWIRIYFLLWFGLITLTLVLFHIKTPLFEQMFDVTLVYGILIAAYHPLLQLKKMREMGDISYGLYIYALPVQQAVILRFTGLSPIPHFFLSIIIAIPIAALSWHFIEGPALKLKDVKYLNGSGKGIGKYFFSR
ncbi:MAG TPA: acyltransferase [Mucilaginibacter sp.]